MQQYHASYEAALAYLQQRRYCVNPNAVRALARGHFHGLGPHNRCQAHSDEPVRAQGFANQLRGFEAIYKAQLAIAHEDGGGNGARADAGGGVGADRRPSTGRKRSNEDLCVSCAWAGGSVLTRRGYRDEDDDGPPDCEAHRPAKSAAAWT